MPLLRRMIANTTLWPTVIAENEFEKIRAANAIAPRIGADVHGPAGFHRRDQEFTATRNLLSGLAGRILPQLFTGLSFT